jgi:PiT family inorganic phosphate transporter
MIHLSERDMKKLKKAEKRKLVRRGYLTSITAAWIITVPLAGLLASGIFYTIMTFK